MQVSNIIDPSFAVVHGHPRWPVSSLAGQNIGPSISKWSAQDAVPQPEFIAASRPNKLESKPTATLNLFLNVLAPSLSSLRDLSVKVVFILYGSYFVRYIIITVVFATLQ